MSEVQQFRKKVRSLDLDLNLPPSPETSFSDSQSTGNDSSDSVWERKKAESNVASKIQLEDLAQYFDLPIKEASKHLKVGLTVLKKRCREFGIPRWPHRKIKCLDGLIHTLEEEVERQLQDNTAVAIAMANKKRMLESEKGTLKRKPFMELQSETKRLRQDVYKRRFLARACKN
ncbi:hypothetical protein QQ045_016443 [Rhodiola kirilowii]